MKMAPALLMRAASASASLGRDLEMLGREPVGKRGRLVEAFDQDDRAEIAPARARGLRARQHGKLGLDRLLDRAGESLHRR